MAENYKLSLTAEDIESRLKKIQDGGVGYTDGETIHPIAQKYIPGVTIPELTITIQEVSTEAMFPLTEEESAELEAVSDNKLLCVVFDDTLNGGSGRYTVLMGKIWPNNPDMPDLVAFQGADHQMYFYGLMNIGGKWFGSCTHLDQMG